MNAGDAGAWSGNWAWSLPLIVLNVVIHVIGRLARQADRSWDVLRVLHVIPQKSRTFSKA